MRGENYTVKAILFIGC